MLGVCPTQLQAELMNLLPEVALDNHHRQIVEALEEMINEVSSRSDDAFAGRAAVQIPIRTVQRALLHIHAYAHALFGRGCALRAGCLDVDGAGEVAIWQDVEFLVPALDTFTAMGLERDLMNFVVELVSQKLHCARVEDLPATVRFLVQSVTADNAKTVAHRLREHLNFVSISDARDAAPDRKQKGKMGGGGGEASILDAVRTGMRFKTSMGATFLRELKDLGKPETPHKVLDVWVLLVLHGNGGPQRKTVETMFHRKVATHQIKASLLDRSILVSCSPPPVTRSPAPWVRCCLSANATCLLTEPQRRTVPFADARQGVARVLPVAVGHLRVTAACQGGGDARDGRAPVHAVLPRL